MKVKSIFLIVITLSFVTNINASVMNTLNGTSYEWLELTATAGQSRDQVDTLLDTAVYGSSFYGYEYASRSLVEELFLSYNSWDGIGGWHAAPSRLVGVDALLNDFGQLSSEQSERNLSAVDGGNVRGHRIDSSDGLYGLEGECGANESCRAVISRLAFFDTTNASYMLGAGGYDSLALNPMTRDDDYVNSSTGSFLVRAIEVPEPSSLWLLMLGFMGLVGYKKYNT